jgi:hypothetical protein
VTLPLDRPVPAGGPLVAPPSDALTRRVVTTFGSIDVPAHLVPQVTDTQGVRVVEKVAALTPVLILTAGWADPKLTWEQAAGNWQALAASAALFARTRWDLVDCARNSWDRCGRGSSHGRVLTAAGVPLGAARQQIDGHVQYSFEQFDRLADTDVIVTTNTADLIFPAGDGIALALLDAVAGSCAQQVAA